MADANSEISDLIASLDAEFGKKVKAKGRSDADIRKERNTAFHLNNPRIEGARGQLDRMKFENYYDWEIHRQALLANELEARQAAGDENLQWLPEAMVTYVIHQQCSCCKSVTQFVGNEYVRFRGRRRFYRDIQGVQHETYPTMLKRVGEVDANLIAFGMPGGDPIPDLVEELNETVRRCAGCILLEQKALDLWVQATQPNPQDSLELNIDIPLTKEGL